MVEHGNIADNDLINLRIHDIFYIYLVLDCNTRRKDHLI